MKKRKKRKEAQRRAYSFKSLRSTAQPERTVAENTEQIINAFKATGLRLVPASSIGRLGTKAREQGLKRFVSLSMKKNKGLIEKLAADYAKIFNAGLVVNSVGIESYYFTPKGKETYCFSSLSGVEKAPEKKTVSQGEEVTLLKKMRIFYQSITMNDSNARRHFVQTIRENLIGDLPSLFNQAIRGA